MKKILSFIAVVSILIGMGMLVNCSENDNPSKEDVSPKADLVVYDKIFTAEGNQMVEAFAVKDGKYVYVGDKAGAEAYVEDGKTEMRNTLIHVYYVNEADYKRIADHNIYVSEGLLWHHASNEEQEAAPKILPANLEKKLPSDCSGRL